ncbi:hypothetical protein [Fodinicola feengrottensis]|uniref:Uncharacterized protein n=1 Tax=Fodinicola feengrottensis TaxID=435914 RepID=A0ABN2IS40_9ACTN|nr:hypothetical protein [Fodinicola feengrottensis]
MSLPTDRGIAFILNNADGTRNVYVAAAASASNAPQDVFAMHLKQKNVKVDPAVTLIPAGTMSRTTEVVHVTGDSNGQVFVQSHAKNLGPMIK